jgi:hypothetical protein
MGEIAARRSKSIAKLAQPFPFTLVGIIRCDASAARGRFSTRAIGASISLSASIYRLPTVGTTCTVRAAVMYHPRRPFRQNRL